MGNFFKNNGLSVVLFSLFAVSFIFMSITGAINYNNEQAEHGEPTVSFIEYLGSGNFVEALNENMESEFLQLFFYVILTAVFYQKGSSESKKIDEPEDVDRDPLANVKENSPGPVKKGGLALKLYENSLSITFFLLFLITFLLHAAGGVKEYNQDQLVHGQSAVSYLGYFLTSRFWFESFQNWQSEFFSIGVMVVFSIFLRQKGSPESKPVYAPHSGTGR